MVVLPVANGLVVGVRVHLLRPLLVVSGRLSLALGPLQPLLRHRTLALGLIVADPSLLAVLTRLDALALDSARSRTWCDHHGGQQNDPGLLAGEWDPLALRGWPGRSSTWNRPCASTSLPGRREAA